MELNLNKSDLLPALSAGVIFSLLAFATSYSITQIERTVLRENALHTAAVYTKSLTDFRTFYTSEVVTTVKKLGVIVSHDYAELEGAIPLPATLSMRLGNEMGRELGVSSSLYSPYPFPWRTEMGGIKRDAFRSAAWLALQQSPETPFYRFESTDGADADNVVLRYASADIMRESCVNCHNNHPDTPKKGWQVGDLRGVLEVKIPLAGVMAITRPVVNRFNVLLISAAGLLVLGVLIIMASLRNSALRLESKVQIRTQELSEEVTVRLGAEKQAIDLANSLEASANFNDNILQSMQDSLIVLDAEGKIQTTNKSTLTLLGFAQQDLAGKMMSSIVGGKDGTGSTNWTNIEQLIQAQGAINVETKYTTQTGALVPIQFSAAIMRDKNGKTQGMVCVAQDMSEIKQAEQRLLDTNTALKTSNTELKNTQAQLVQSAKLAAIGELSTGLAHELSQPLGVITMSADLRLKEIEEGKYNNTEESYHLILKQVDRAVVIINHLKTFGRESNTLQRTATAINPIIEDSFIMISEQLRLQGITVVKDLDENLPQVYCNHIQIEQVLTNLAINAKDALAETQNKKIMVRSFLSRNNITIEIEDNGEGIAESKLSKIFDPFYTSKPAGKGTGLGLSISYGLINDHGGKISVTTTKGKGSTFRIELPPVKN